MTTRESQWCHVFAILLAIALLQFTLSVRGEGLSSRMDEPQLLTSVAYGGGRFVAVGNDFTIMVSEDGTNWVRNGAEVADPGIGINYSLETYVAGGDAVTFIHPEKSDAPRILPSLNTEFRAIAYGGGTFVIVGDCGRIQTSRSVKSWTVRRSGTLLKLSAVCWGGNRFVAVGEGGTILTSADGTVWKVVSAITDSDLRAVAYGNGISLP